MENLFENEYLMINRNTMLDCLEVIGKNRSEEHDFKQSMKTIQYYSTYSLWVLIRVAVFEQKTRHLYILHCVELSLIFDNGS